MRAAIVQTWTRYSVGVAAWRLGAGRARKEDPVSAGAGVLCLVREGDHVEHGRATLRVVRRRRRRTSCGAATRSATPSNIGDDRCCRAPILLEKITK